MSKVEEAKLKVAECESEISKIKESLRAIGPGDANASPKNELQVAMTKTEGLPPSAEPKLHLQLSSPIEEATLTEVFDANVEIMSESMLASFRGVETNNATLSVSLEDAEIPLGTTQTIDLGPYCSLEGLTDDPEGLSEGIVSSLEVAMQTEDESEVICTVHLRLTYIPSVKDKRDALYDQLNQVTQKKAAATQELRKAVLEASRSGAMASSRGSPAVKPGFLNKEPKEKSKLQQIYEKYIKPIIFIAPVAKNYVIFFGGIAWMHFQGQNLALPPPV